MMIKKKLQLAIIVLLFFGVLVLAAFKVFPDKSPDPLTSPGSSVAFQNLTEAKYPSGNGIMISAPSGFSAGDLFIVYITKDDDVLIGEDSDWTTLHNETSGGAMSLYIAWRIAEAGDTNWTWYGDNEGYYGVILRYTGQKAFTETTFYFDGSDVAASDPDNVWDNETNSDDGNVDTDATNVSGLDGDKDNRYIEIQGTDASGSDIPIIVEIRVHNGISWTPYRELDVPAGGWTWAKVAALETRFWYFLMPDYITIGIYEDGDAGGTDLVTSPTITGDDLSKIELKVLSSTPIYDSGVSTGTNNTPIAPSVSYTDLESGSLSFQAFGADDNDIPYTSPATERFNDSVTTTGGAGSDKAESGTGSTGTGTFGMNASEQWAAITVVIEAAAEVSVKRMMDVE